MPGNRSNNLLGPPRPPELPARPPEVSDETINRFIDLSLTEAANKREELELRREEILQNSKHAEKILGAQERDREAERQHELKRSRDKLWFWGFCALVVVALIVAAMIMNKDAFILDMIKVLVGGVAGWGVSKAQGARKKEED